MTLTLVIHRQLTSLAEIFDGLAQGLHKILPANLGETPDKLRFSGNKSLLGENDLMEKTFDGRFAHKFHSGGNSPFCRLPAAGHASTCFSSQWEELGGKLQLFCVMDCTTLCGGNPAKHLINRVFQVINHYMRKMI